MPQAASTLNDKITPKARQLFRLVKGNPLTVLFALMRLGGEAGLMEICELTTLTDKTVERALNLLRDCNLVARSHYHRGFTLTQGGAQLPFELTNGQVPVFDMASLGKRQQLAVPQGYVYFIQDDDLIKIGYSASPNQRLRTLQASHSQTLSLVAFFPALPEQESELHRRFQALRVAGEWFRFEDPVKTFIEEEEKSPKYFGENNLSTTATESLGSEDLAKNASLAVAEADGKNSEVLAALKAAGIGNPSRNRLAADPFLTSEYIRGHAAMARQDGKSVGMLIHRLRSHDSLPAKFLKPACTECGQHGNHAADCRRKYVDDKYSDSFAN